MHSLEGTIAQNTPANLEKARRYAAALNHPRPNTYPVRKRKARKK